MARSRLSTRSRTAKSRTHGKSVSDLPTRASNTCARTKMCLASTQRPSASKSKSTKSSSFKTFVPTHKSRSRYVSKKSVSSYNPLGTTAPYTRTGRSQSGMRSARRSQSGMRSARRSQSGMRSATGVSDYYDVEAHVRVVVLPAPVCTGCRIVAFVISQLIAILLAVLVCHYLRYEEADATGQSVSDVRNSHASLVTKRNKLQIELDGLLELLADPEYASLSCWGYITWLWKYLLGGLGLGLFSGYGAGVGQCEPIGLADDWKFAKNLKGTGFGEAQSCSDPLGSRLGNGDYVVGCTGNTPVAMGKIPDNRCVKPAKPGNFHTWVPDPSRQDDPNCGYWKDTSCRRPAKPGWNYTWVSDGTSEPNCGHWKAPEVPTDLSTAEVCSDASHARSGKKIVDFKGRWKRGSDNQEKRYIKQNCSWNDKSGTPRVRENWREATMQDRNMAWIERIGCSRGWRLSGNERQMFLKAKGATKMSEACGANWQKIKVPSDEYPFDTGWR